jgi:MFS family permease
MRDFKLLIVARFFFTLAVQMQAVVLGWQMYQLTGEALYLGLIGLVEAVPAIGLALFAGYIVDRSRPLFVYRWVLLGSLFSGLLMLVSQHENIGISIQLQVVLLYMSSFITGAGRGFSHPSMYAAVPRLVPREKLTEAYAWAASIMQVARISGPAFGGLLFGFAGMTFTAALICALLVIASFALTLIKNSPAPANIGQRTQPIKDELLIGARFVFKHKLILPALTLDMVSVLFGGVTALLPIYASEILMIGPKGLGLLRAAPAVGATIMSFLQTRIQFKEKAGLAMMWSITGFGVCILIFSLSENLWLSMAALALSGAFDSISVIIRGTMVQLASPDNMRGRISAVNSIFIGSSNELGELESGLAAHLLGTVPAAVFGSVMCLLTVGVVAWVSPALRQLNLRHLEQQNPAAMD